MVPFLRKGLTQHLDGPAPGVEFTPPADRFDPAQPAEPGQSEILGVMRGFVGGAEVVERAGAGGYGFAQEDHSPPVRPAPPPMIAIRRADEDGHGGPPGDLQTSQGHVKVGRRRAKMRQNLRGRQNNIAVLAAMMFARRKPTSGL